MLTRRQRSSYVKEFHFKPVKKLIILLCLVGITSAMYGQDGTGTSGLTDATSQVTDFFNPVSKLIIAIGAIVGLAGGVRVYAMWNNGHRHIEREIVGWFGSCIFLELVAVIMREMFL